MSEAHTPPATGFGTDPAPPGSAGAALYPDGGGSHGSANAPVAPVGDAATGGDTSTATTGADTTTGSDTQTGTDTTSGTDTTTGTDTTSGADTTTGTDTQSGTDALTVDSYKDLTLPEGFVVDDALLTTAKTTFAELGVKPDLAPKLLDLYAQVTKATNEQATADFQATQTKWLGEINAMPEFQGEARATSLQSIGKVFDEYGTPEAKAALDAFGTGNHPALVKMFLRMANALSEGTPTTQGRPAPTGKDGKPASQQGKTIGQRLYPDQAQP